MGANTTHSATTNSATTNSATTNSAEQVPRPPYCFRLGSGSRSTVWCVPDSAVILKCNAFCRKEAATHQIMQESLHLLRGQTRHAFDKFHIPELVTLVDRRSPWWRSHIGQFPAGHIPTDALVNERILPFSREITNNILFTAVPSSQHHSIMYDGLGNNSFVRPYLGKKRSQMPPSITSHGDITLCIDEMRALDLPVESYALAMADALAMMLWQAETDGAKVDFVLASPGDGHLWSSAFDSDVLGRHALWLFDFDEVEQLELDLSTQYPDEGVHRFAVAVDQICDAFFANAAYYPDPAANDEDGRGLWQAFQRRFLDSSESILGESAILAYIVVKKLVEKAVQPILSFQDLLISSRETQQLD